MPVGIHDNRPNIVLIQADDQTTAQFNRRVMPRTFKLLVDHGTMFTDYIATTAECCPSRASLITGQYAHNHGVSSNQVGYPGLRGKHDVLPVWLRRSGYQTMEVGSKYLNGYRELAGKKPAPGWSVWFNVLSHTQYYDYKLSANGHERTRAKQPADYITRVLARKATRLIQKRATSTQPFYLQLDERAPHVTRTNDPYGGCDRLPVPDRRDEQAFAHARLPDSGSFNEDDMSDKPAYLRSIPSLGFRFKGHLLTKWRCALDSMIGVDRSVANLVQAVKKAGELNRTIFIYISDNGLFYGQHRVVKGKVFPYEEAIRLPLVMQIPKRYRDGAARLKRTGKLVGNIDLAPTILDLAHARPCARGKCRTMDGRSLMPLLTGHGQWPRDRALLNEYKLPDLPHYSTCRFVAIRTRSEIYVEHHRVVNSATHECQATLEKERYNLKDDPYELDSLCYGGAPDSCPHDATQTELERRLQRLRHCAGIRGRDHRVDGRPFCD
jgi:N-acetylglucosamine-6-sulfatase